MPVEAGVMSIGTARLNRYSIVAIAMMLLVRDASEGRNIVSDLSEEHIPSLI